MTDVVEEFDNKIELKSASGLETTPGGLGHSHLTQHVCGVPLVSLSLFERNKGIGHV